MNEEISVRKAILKKLFKHRYIGGRHTEIRNVIKGLPQELKVVELQPQPLLKRIKIFHFLTFSFFSFSAAFWMSGSMSS